MQRTGPRSTLGDRLFIEAVLYRAKTGLPWRDLPERFGPWQTVYDHFSKWRKSGVYAAIIDALQVKLDDRGKIDWELWCVDGSVVRGSRAAAGADKKVSNATPTSLRTTRWAAAEAGLGPSSIWSRMATARRWPSRSRPDRSTNRRARSR